MNHETPKHRCSGFFLVTYKVWHGLALASARAVHQLKRREDFSLEARASTQFGVSVDVCQSSKRLITEKWFQEIVAMKGVYDVWVAT